MPPEPVLPSNVDPEYGYTWHLNQEDAMQDATENAGRVVVHCGNNENIKWATVWKAQPLARFLTRGGEVVWQGHGLQGHWDG